MNRKVLLSIAVLMLAALACQTLFIPSVSTNRVIGSGREASEARQVAGEFTSVELAGSADVNILVTNVQSVNVAGDDNIVPLIETTVVNGKLIVNTKPNMSYTTSNPVIVTVGIKSLERVTLSGSGNMQLANMSGADLILELTGSGNLTAEGKVDHVSISLPGSGNVMCDQLKAHTADATLQGSGNITLYADQSLNASVPGSGEIRYEGNPAKVTKNVSGSGEITP